MSLREEKKAQFTERKNKSKSLVLILGIAALAIVAAGGFWFMSGPADASRYVTAQNGKVEIPLDQVNDGQAHYFKYQAGDRTVSFFLLKSGDGVIRAALDACDVCYKALKGYRQEGDFMVCNNCDQKFQSNMINVVKGGCNPAPLTRTIDDRHVVLHERELMNGQRYFPTSG